MIRSLSDFFEGHQITVPVICGSFAYKRQRSKLWQAIGLGKCEVNMGLIFKLALSLA